MGKKKLSEIKAEVAAILEKLPGKSPEAWLDKEIELARGDPSRDIQTLEMLCAALEHAGKGRRKIELPHRPAKH